MKTFHIVYYASPTNFYSTGKNYFDHSMIEALRQFKKEFPDKEPIMIVEK